MDGSNLLSPPCLHGTAHDDSITCAPSCTGSSTLQTHFTPSVANRASISSAMLSKFSVASASIVGPAPDRQIPSRPGWDFGVMEVKMSGSAGICKRKRTKRQH
ncbi:hypothetical protein Dda_0916 [Drechslerella dactyloides]|uniref:Uncharacterized protein n=1 Tax=Drechslerella dactyloides TaxID=74499 RepID=A0AAD6J5D5_DREDA|nr:hypothetical protein Dda_0916 [Drechslerella dactyloides]